MYLSTCKSLTNTFMFHSYRWATVLWHSLVMTRSNGLRSRPSYCNWPRNRIRSARDCLSSNSPMYINCLSPSRPRAATRPPGENFKPSVYKSVNLFNTKHGKVNTINRSLSFTNKNIDKKRYVYNFVSLHNGLTIKYKMFMIIFILPINYFDSHTKHFRFVLF